MTHWLYPVNPTNAAAWGYQDSPTELMSRKKETRTWHLPRKIGLTAGDLIWVRESVHPGNPSAMVVGVGVVSSDEPWPEGDAYCFGVVFGTDLCRYIAANPISLTVDAIPMTARKLKDAEQVQVAQALFEYTVRTTRKQAERGRLSSLAERIAP